MAGVRILVSRCNVKSWEIAITDDNSAIHGYLDGSVVLAKPPLLPADICPARLGQLVLHPHRPPCWGRWRCLSSSCVGCLHPSVCEGLSTGRTKQSKSKPGRRERWCLAHGCRTRPESKAKARCERTCARVTGGSVFVFAFCRDSQNDAQCVRWLRRPIL